MRRAFVSMLIVAGLWALGLSARPIADAAAPTAAQLRPNPVTLQTGDLVWPRLPNAVVPFNGIPDRPTFEQRRALVQGLSYEQFLEVFLGGAPVQNPGPLGTNVPYVGHVGVIEMRGTVPWVIEAVLSPGAKVRDISYDQWLGERPIDMVWHGRVKDADVNQRAQIAREAMTWIGKPYNFFNLNLRDESGFYCSKLAWLAIVKATGKAPDDNLNGDRSFWYSPKQLMTSPHVAMLFSPMPYGRQGQ